MQTQRIAMRPKANNAAIDAALLGQPLAAGALTTADLILMAARANATTAPLIAMGSNAHAISDAVFLRRPLAAAALQPIHLARMSARANAVTGPLIGTLIAPQAAVPPAVLPPAPVQLHFQPIGGRPPPHPPVLVPIARRRNKRPRPPGSGSEK